MKLTTLFICILVLNLTVKVAAGNKNARLDGTFIQAGLCGAWTDEQWQKEYDVMKEAGMHYIVIGYVADRFFNDSTNYMLYPSELKNTKLSRYVHGNDMVDIALRNAEKNGIKVFISIGMQEDWYNGTGIDSTWLYDKMEFDNKVVDEVWARYKHKYPETFYGWYWAYEVANFKTPENQCNVLIKAMNMQLDHMTATGKKLPFMWCPYMNAKIGTAAEFQKFWEYILPRLHTTDGDIFCPQDCVGAGGLTIDQVDEWFNALGKAVKSKPGLKFWSDVETFDHTDWSSATIDRITRQVEIERPYVENYITFAYSHYNSPNSCDPGFHKTYMGYLKNGVLEQVPPSVPEQFTVVFKTDSAIISWEPSTDNIGVCGYYIYRNDSLVSKKQFDNPASTLNFVDKGIKYGETYTYKIEAYDFANNKSKPAVQKGINK